jgi:hypothetical protein
MGDCSFSTSFINEHGKSIYVEVSKNTETGEVIITGKGPESECDHTWTQMEAEAILKGLRTVLNKGG